MSFKTTLLSTSSAFVFSFFIQSLAGQAADVAQKGDLCAVSAVNGKLNVNGGLASNNTINSTGAFGADGSFSIPLGCSFGFQLDAGFQNELNRTTYGGVAHFFTRDPNSYLLGVTGGYFNGGDSSVWAVGPEAELYIDRVSLEAWGGYANVSVNGFAATDQGFIFADAAFYPVDDLRMSIGATVLDDARFLRAGLEYQVADGISTSLTGKIGDDNYVAVKAGLTFYFGGEGGKTLIRRHREDDPRSRLVDFRSTKSVAPAPTTLTPTTTPIRLT